MTGAPTNGWEFTMDDPETPDQAVNLPEVLCHKIRGVSRKLPLDPRQPVIPGKRNPRHSFHGNFPCFALKATAARANSTSPVNSVCAPSGSRNAPSVSVSERPRYPRVSTEASWDDAISGLSKSTVVALILFAPGWALHWGVVWVPPARRS